CFHPLLDVRPDGGVRPPQRGLHDVTEPPQERVDKVVAPVRLRRASLLRFAVTVLLLAATLGYQGFQAFWAFEPDDTNHLETPLIAATARQLVDGPSTLYGPYSGSDPLVLIHAPLYYRLSGLLAWPIARLGHSPMVVAMIAGRSLAFVGLLVLSLAVWRIGSSPG